MTLEEAKITIYANCIYACEKAGFDLSTICMVDDALRTVIAIADRKTEPQTDWETEKRDNSLCYKCVKECDRRVLNRYTIECNQYEPKGRAAD